MSFKIGGNIKMKTKKAKKEIIRTVNLLAKSMVVYTANAACLWAFHQPRVPRDIRKFRKF